MRNDQIAVLLRDFANRCLQWAAVLDADAPPSEWPKVFYEPHSGREGPGSDEPLAEEVPSGKDGTAGTLGSLMGALTQTAAAPVPANPVVVATQGSISPSTTTGNSFLCPSCKVERHWHLSRPRWQGAICSDCYAKSRGL